MNDSSHFGPYRRSPDVDRGFVILLPAAIMGCVQAIANAENVRMIPLVLGPPVAMILIPWLVRRRQSTARSGSLAS